MSRPLEILSVSILLIIAAFFATLYLKESPSVWYDEGYYIQSAANLATHGQMGLQFAPGIVAQSSFITVGYPLIQPLALWFKVFGISVISARSLMVVFILSFLLASYFLARRLFGTTVALGTLAILVTLPPLYGNGKSVLGEVPGLFYLVLFLLCFVVARSSSYRMKYVWLIASALFAGLCVSTKPTFLLLLPAIAIGVFLEWKRGAFSSKELSVAALAGLVPILYWFYSQFQTSDSLSSILTNYTNPYQIQGMFSIIVGNIARLFTGVGSLYLVVLMVIWIFALWIRVRKQTAVSSVEVIAFVFALLTIGNYARTTGWFRYLFEAQIVSLLFFPNAFRIVWESVSYRAKMLIPKLNHHIFSPTKTVFAAVILLTVLGGYQVLFSSFVAESYGSHRTAFWESYFNDASSSTSYFFYNTPEVALFMQNENYYQYLNPVAIRGLPGEGLPIGKEQLQVIQTGGADKIILRSTAYRDNDSTLFALYIVDQVAYQYTILKRQSP